MNNSFQEIKKGDKGKLANKVKKKYVAPDLYYENFEMSEHVATCYWDMSNSTDGDVCQAKADEEFYDDSIVLFADGNTGCTLKSSKYKSYCWTNGGSGENVFNS